jgi:hypothetical protein
MRQGIDRRAVPGSSAWRYYFLVIKSFPDKETEKVFNRHFSRKLPADIQRSARRKLEVLEAASDYRICGFHRPTGLKNCRGAGMDSTASESTSNGVFVLSGVKRMLIRLRLLITIE